MSTPQLLHAEQKESFVGRSILRKEDEEKYTGKAVFAADVYFKDMLYAGIYRSPYAHAIIKNVDISKALEMDGISGGLKGSDLHNLEYLRPLAPFPFQSRDPFKRGNPRIKFFDHYCLATDKVRFVGEPVAAVVGRDKYVVEDALEAIEADFEPLEPVLDAESALKEGSPLLYKEWGDNAALYFQVSGGDVERALKNADAIVREKIYSGRFTGTPLEPRSVVADYDGTSSLLSVWDSTQIPHNISRLIQKTIGIPSLKVRVFQPRVGGGFGQKWGFYPEEIIVPLLSIIMRRPVKWIETRSEHMVGTAHAREQVHDIEAGVTKDGKILGIRDHIIANAGAAYPVGGLASIVTSAFFVPGAYKIENYEADITGVTTNKTPFGAHRGFGKAEPAYVIEKLVDIIAERLSLDPSEVRFRNFIQPSEFPYVSVTGPRYDSGNYPEALRKAMELSDYWGFKQKQGEYLKNNRYVGIGMALVVEPSSSTRMGSYNAGYYSVRIRMDPDGRVFVFLSGGEEGQGHITTSSQIVADVMQIPFDDIHVVEGDTLACPVGSGSYSSRFSVVGTSGVYGAAMMLREKVLAVAANMMKCRPEDLDIAGSKVLNRSSPDRSLSMQEISQAAYYEVFRLPQGMEPGLEMLYHYRDPNIQFQSDERGRVAMFSSFPYDAEVAVVEVDIKTGFVKILKFVSVHDCGNMLNPMIVEGQHTGALAHGIGGALYEELAYDSNGQPLNTTFKDYLVPTSMEVPEFVLSHLITPNPFTPGGFKGAGETGTIGPPPALSNAVEDALRPLGVKLRKTPLSPVYIKSLIEGARSGAGERSAAR